MQWRRNLQHDLYVLVIAPSGKAILRQQPRSGIVHEWQAAVRPSRLSFRYSPLQREEGRPSGWGVQGGGCGVVVMTGQSCSIMRRLCFLSQSHEVTAPDSSSFSSSFSVLSWVFLRQVVLVGVSCVLPSAPPSAPRRGVARR